MNSVDNAIEVNNVKKYFKVYYDRGITLKDKVLSRGRSRYEKREVLKGISFSVKKGEAIGLIGKNGCGKSTTLKLLTKIIYPNEGTVKLQGRVSSLLELGAGFHPDMSGKENIYMNAAVFGLNRKEIDKRVDDIIKFSELEEFIDNPVRTYSSGMYMRLAFSVAINVDADILLIDEILAVGDISFQKKCFEKLKEIKRNGTTIVIVSHSLDQIEKICDRSIWIENGLIKEEGKPKNVHENYLYDMEKARLEQFQEEYYEVNTSMDEKNECEEVNTQINDFVEKIELEGQEGDSQAKKIIGLQGIEMQMMHFNKNFLSDKNESIRHEGKQDVVFTEMYITDKNGEETIIFETGDNIVVYLKYESKGIDLTGTLCLMIYRDDGVYCYGTNTYIENREILKFGKKGFLRIEIQQLPLLPGKYYFSIANHDEEAVDRDRVEHVAFFQVFSSKGEQGITRINTEWTVEMQF